MRHARGHFAHGCQARHARQPFLRQVRVLRAPRLFGHVHAGTQPSGRATIGVAPRDATPVDTQTFTARAARIEFALSRPCAVQRALKQEPATFTFGFAMYELQPVAAVQVDGVRTEDVTTARVDFDDAPLGIEHQQMASLSSR